LQALSDIHFGGAVGWSETTLGSGNWISSRVPLSNSSSENDGWVSAPATQTGRPARSPPRLRQKQRSRDVARIPNASPSCDVLVLPRVCCPDWTNGSLIGAINHALIVGNAKERGVTHSVGSRDAVAGRDNLEEGASEISSRDLP
jgi:hypothetical protein